MAKLPRLTGPFGHPASLLATCVAWSAVAATAVSMLRRDQGLVIAGLSLAALAATVACWCWSERIRWARPARRLAAQVVALAESRQHAAVSSSAPELDELVAAVRALDAVARAYGAANGRAKLDSRLMPAMPRSGLYDPPSSLCLDGYDANASGDFSTTDMVSRLEPGTLRWLESSPAEQEFLGWSLAELRERSFLDIVHPDDRARARAQLTEALAKGEAHGLLYRIETASGRPKAIEMNVGARYGPDLAVTHLRCHVADVTAKVRAERELRLRTRELTKVNEQLRQINRELEELKERYRDLYQNAPAMYFSLDERGCFRECNDTLLRTLGYTRGELIGASFERLLPDAQRPSFAEKFAEFLRRGSIELESRWVKSSGEAIDIWLNATCLVGHDGKVELSRCVAQDITTRRRLEAALGEKHERLERINEELSRKNREMDEFTYVVSHDLQEPLRTLIAFSDFLVKDCGERLDEGGREYVRYIVDASRRMRSLIQGLLSLSRAGRVTADFGPVNVEELVEVIRADLGELIRAKGAEVRLAGPLPTLWGDRDRIGQLLANLVGNGLKYNAREHPLVEVGAVEPDGEGWATLFVRDDGIGIEPKFHDKIFQLFRRLHTPEEYEGTGAGLAICLKIVQAHGGRIWVESEPGRGATFFVRLPRPQRTGAAAPTQAAYAS